MVAHDQLVTIATVQARDIVALPDSERDERYAALRAEYQVKARALGLPGDAADELVEQMETVIRRLVGRIEAGEWIPD